MAEVYLGLGSNLGDRRAHLRYALDRLREHCDIKKVSSLYETEPVDCPGPESYLNAVAFVETELPPRDLMRLLLAIEAERGRVRQTRNEPRTLDLDILLYGQDVIETGGLRVPHPRLHERAFVLVPLAEVAPDLRHPTLEAAVCVLAEGVCGKESVHQIEQDWWRA
jgi:2-amino-4-hydroxy-6-hydroxymethyldihydropteridine diphosphokinase